ncbi:MAG TPA: hypothetical protein VGK67_26830 [Myxococcales bacterium]
MRARLLAALLFLAAGCSGEVFGNLDDAGSGPGLDAALPGSDGAVEVDSGEPGLDASLPPADAASPTPPDAASPGLDAASLPGPDAAAQPGPDAGSQPGPGLWVTAYIAGWNLNVPPNAAYGTMPGTAVDYTAFTHGVLFALNVMADGTLCCIADWDTFAPDRIQSAVSGGHYGVCVTCNGSSTSTDRLACDVWGFAKSTAPRDQFTPSGAPARLLRERT